MFFTAIVFSAVLGLNNNSTAKSSESDTLNIQTSAECDMCKLRLEKEMAFEKGVKTSKLNLEDMVLTVVYNPTKTNAETIKKRICNTGYDADDLTANPKAYEKLPDCCKKGAHDHE